MAKSLSSMPFVFLVFLSLIAYTNQNVRKKRQILPDQPRIVTENGHLMFKAGSSRNITFQTSSGGGIFIDGFDVKYAATQVKANTDRLDSLQPSSGSSNITSRLVAVETQVAGISSLRSQIGTVSTSLDGLRAQQQSSVNSINTRLSNLEQSTGSSGSTGGGSSSGGGDSSSMSALTQRVRRLEQQTGRLRISLRQAGRYMRRIRQLRTQVTNLVNRLTVNDCSSNPCQNGGTCIDMYNGFLCNCPSNYKGLQCTQDVNECAEYAGTSLGCQNGATCINFNGGFRCQCATNWHGIHCTEQHDDCTGASHSELCGHGTCINEERVLQGQIKYRCLCDPGWTKSGSDPACNIDINECESGRHCSANPPVQCINIPGSFACGPCPQGYEGNGFTCSDIDECAINNGGCSLSPRVDCINTMGSRSCGPCPSGYQGDGVTCTFVGHCQLNNGGCHPLATCADNTGGGGRICVCPSGYVGSGVGPSGCQQQSTAGACASNPCQNGARCLAIGTGTFSCVCQAGFTGVRCETQINPCDSNPCQNGGTCSSNGATYTCACTNSYTGDNCQNRQEGCGGYLSGETGSFQYPRTTGTSYSHQLSCAWVITTSFNKILRLTFPRFSLEGGGQDCRFDFLQIHDGPSASAYMIGKYCGNTPPNGGSINTTHNQVYLWFYTDASVSSTGFQVQWTSLMPVCGGTLTGSDHGTINSPGYPGNYPHNRDCVWSVAVSPGKNIMFQFAYIAIEQHSTCDYDYLEIRDGELSSAPLIERYCTSPNQTVAPVQTTGPYAYLRFHTDASISDRGFHITYAALDTGREGCGGQLTGDEGQFTSPGYPSPYDHNSQCVWVITTSPGNQVQLSFTSFDLETDSTCDYDYVMVRDGANETAPSLGSFCGNDNPPALTSTGNVLFVKFSTDASISGSGFQAQWTTGCGGLFTGTGGQIQSPLYPNPYPHNKVCGYLIQVEEGMRVRLEFQAFSLEDGYDNTCQYDYVRIYNGPNENSPALGQTYCGSTRPDLLRSTGNQMFVIFRTDGSVTNTGFSATYTAEDASNTQECGGIVNADSGIIQSPGFPNSYDHGVNCTWIITAQPGFVIRLFFHSLNLEGSGRYCPDYVEVYDNSSINLDSRRGRFCGSTTPDTITTTDNYMVVVFKSDNSIAREGFSASFISLNVSQLCGQTLTASTGVITSPNYPQRYPHGRRCEWIIVADSGNQIRVNITNFLLEGSSTCRYDYLEFRNGGRPSSPLLGKYCGYTYPTSPFMSHGNRLYIKFVTDGSVSRSGFRLEYDSGNSGCGGDMTTPTGALISPNYPEAYNHRAQCFWTITTSRGSTIFLVFSDFELESHSRCRYDYLEIRETGPTGRMIGSRRCGTQIPLPIISRTNRLWIKMKTDSSVSGRGFQARYYTRCNSILTDRTGVIESPNFPNAYPHRSNCTWYIEAPRGSKINISFAAFHLEYHSSCGYDRLEIRDGNSTTSPVIQSLCSNSLPEPIRSQGRFVTIRFTSDRSVSRQGFRLEYAFDGCGDNLYGSSGVITSPNYPQNYPPRTQCLWTITVPTGKSVVLNITNFDLEGHAQCRYDSLQIYGGSDTTGPRLSQLCHTQTSPQIISTTGNTMTLTFESDSSISGTGFSATYSAADGGCGGNFSTARGTIRSQNYPNNYPHNTECEWLITVEPAHVVQMNFTDFVVEGGRCNYDYVKLYDGANTSTPLIATLCGRSLSQISYRSSSNQMFVRMRTDSSVTYRGFSASYETGCGGTLNADDGGIIQTPNYRARYSSRTRCVWVIRSAHNDRRITLTFTSMDLPQSPDCNHVYVAISDGIDAQDNSTTKLCGNTLPAAITSFGSALTVVFQATRSYAAYHGFMASYSSADSACGGTFQADSGRFTSPGYPDNYPVNTECIWQIQVSPGNALMLSFLTFQLEQNGGLNDDYVEVRTPDVNGQLVGRFIGQGPPSNLTGNLHGAWIKFRSNDVYPALGFMAEWNTEYGGELQANTGQLASPQYPRRYPNNAQYTWTITVDQNRIVRMTFSAFQLEGQSTSGSGASVCYYDWVQLLDGPEDSGTEIGKYCGSQNPGTIFSTSNIVTVIFRTDSSVRRPGFLLTWTAVNGDDRPIVVTPTPSVDGCGGNFVATENWVNFSSPGGLQGYSDNLDCQWDITVPVGSSVMANISYMNIEGHSNCAFDYVAFFDGPTTSPNQRIGPKYCGRSVNTMPIKSMANTMRILFHTDSSVNRTGFTIAFKIGCGGTFTTRTGIIQSPGYPNQYPALSNCTWRVRARTGKTVLVSFSNQPNAFNIASSGTCPNDYLLLLNGYSASSPPLVRANSTSNTNGRYCGNIAPQDLETSDRFLYASFISDSSGSGHGFAVNFRENSVACGGRIVLTHTITSRYISSPNYPENYPQNMDCIWIIIAPATETITLAYQSLQIEPHSQCNFDSVQIRDGGTIYAPPLGPPSCGTSDTVPSSQTTTSNMMFVRFVTDSSVTRQGFNALVSLATCGGHFSDRSGIITSPNYPQQYDINQDCVWTIAAPTGHYIVINVTNFNLQYTTNCSGDYLEVLDGNSTSSSLLRRCGSSYIGSIRTSDNTAYIHFRSDASTVANGFRIAYEVSLEVCGGDLTTSTGTFTSPSYPNRYAHNRRCTWIIRVAEGRRVTLNFDDFDLEVPNGRGYCAWDAVEVYNGNIIGSPRLGRYCGSSIPPTIESSGNSMAVVFRADRSVSHRGFRATYTSDQPITCGGLLSSNSGNITSGSGTYNHSLQCIWRVETRGLLNSSLVFQFNNMHLEYHTNCRFDMVEIREGSTQRGALVGRYCGNSTTLSPIVIPANQAYVMFRTDFSVAGDGFTLVYGVSNCGGVRTSSQGVIASPNYPSNYDHNDGCAWLIQAPEGSQIQVTFTDFDFENHTDCGYDYLQIQNGGLPNSPVVGKYCGNSQPPTFTSQSNQIRILMITDVSESARGFRLTYTTRSEGCGGLFHTPQGNISSPNYPSSYPHNTECRWDINVGTGYRVALTFIPPFDLEFGNPCTNDYVEVFDSYPNGTTVSIGRYCGNQAPARVYSSASRLLVVFRSNGATNGNGFAAYWEGQCGGLYTSNTGVLYSPNFPSDYPNNILCNYTIAPLNQQHIYLIFNSFELEGGSRCQWDSLVIRQGNDSTGRYLGRLCGTTQPDGISAVGSMFLQFRTDSSLTFNGFQASYSAEGCGGAFGGPYGRISSPLFPSNYHDNANCTWSITVASNRIVILKFDHFNIEAHPACNYDSVSFYDGPDTSSSSIGRLCGSIDNIPQLIRSTGNQMTINFVSDGSVRSTGFSGSYWESYGPAQGCGGTIRQSAGTITSLDADGNGQYEDNLDCEWSIYAGENKVVTLTFTSMDVENSNNCIMDFIKVYDGESRQNVLGTFCGNTIPSPITASSNVLIVVFHTDSSVQGAGFSANYVEVDRVCGGSFNATQTPTVITSPNFPGRYPGGVTCSWIIDSGSSYSQVQIRITAIFLPESLNCTQNYVVVQDQPLLQSGQTTHYCGSALPQPFYSRGQRVAITYVTNGMSLARGFVLEYSVASCDRNFTNQGGEITSPNYPDVYPHYQFCRINITTAANTYLSLYFFDFQTEAHSSCQYDFLQVTNSSGFELAKVCGSTIPTPIFMSDNRAQLIFRTDQSVNRQGFSLTYVASTGGPGCGGDISYVARGAIASPDYPNNSSLAQTCEWTIRPPRRQQLRLYFTFLSMSNPSDCYRNYIMLLVPTAQSTSARRFCNEGLTVDNAAVITTTMIVRYVNSGDGAAPIFNINFRT